MTALPPDPPLIVWGCAAAVLAALACCAAAGVARTSGNWLLLVVAAGAAAVLAGLAGQRAFPTDDSVRRLGQQAAASSTPGPWDAGVSLPLTGVRATPVAVGGALTVLAGAALVLFLEVPADGPRPPRPPPPLDEGDAA